MRSSLHFGVATGVLAFLISQPAMAQNCGTRVQALTMTATTIVGQGGPTGEQLNKLFEQTMYHLGNLDEPNCLRSVAEMETLIRQRQGGGVGATMPPATQTAEEPARLAASALPRPPITPVRDPAPGMSNLERRITRLPPQLQAEVRDVAEHAEVLRGIGRTVVQEIAPTSPAAANSIVDTVNDGIATSETLVEVLIDTSDQHHINAPGDQNHAAFEDAVRDMQELSRRTEALQSEFNAAIRDANETRGDQIQAEFDRAHRAGDTERARELGDQLDAERDRTDAAYERATRLGNQLDPMLDRLDASRAKVKRITDRINGGVEEVDEDGFLPGLKQAEAWLNERQQRETLDMDRRCEALQERAQRQYVEDLQRGFTATTALSDGMNACQAMALPQQARQVREWNEMVERYTPLYNDDGTPRRRPTTPPRGQRPTPTPETQPPANPSPPISQGQAQSEAADLLDKLREERRRFEDLARSRDERQGPRGDDDAIVRDAQQRVDNAEAAYRRHVAAHNLPPDARYIPSYQSSRPSVPNEHIRDSVDSAPPPERPTTPDVSNYDGPQGTNPDHIMGTRPGERSVAPRDMRSAPAERSGVSDLPDYQGRSGTNPDHLVPSEYGRPTVLPPSQRSPVAPTTPKP